MDKIKEIMSLAMLLENLIGDDYTIFVDYSGHVKIISVRVYYDYRGKREVLLREEFYDDLRHGTEAGYKACKDILTELITEFTRI